MFEAGLFHFLKMIVAVAIKGSTITHLEVNLITNCNDEDDYHHHHHNKLLNYDLHSVEYQHFLNIFSDILSKHNPVKTKYIRATPTSKIANKKA